MAKVTRSDRVRGRIGHRLSCLPTSGIRGSPVQAASVIRRDARHRWGAATGRAVMRFIAAPILVLASTAAMAEPLRKTFKDANGREVGRSVSDGRNTVFYDAAGRTTGRSVTDSRGNATFHGATGRNTGRAITNGNTTTTYDSFGRRTGSISR